MLHSLICKIIKSDNIKNQRTALVLNKPDDKFPTYINFHKNYTDADGIEVNKVYILDIYKAPEQYNGYDSYKIKGTLELGKMSYGK